MAWHSFNPADLSAAPSASHNTLSGLDLEGGGTWLGISLPTSSSKRTGLRFGTLTNYTETIAPSARPSRGQLVKDFLETDLSLEAYLERVEGEMADFAGFNLLLGEMRGEEMCMGYATNREGDALRPRILDNEGVKGVSNSTLASERESEWPKVRSGCAAFDSAVKSAQGDEQLVESLWDVLRCVHLSIGGANRSQSLRSQHCAPRPDHGALTPSPHRPRSTASTRSKNPTSYTRPPSAFCVDLGECHPRTIA